MDIVDIILARAKSFTGETKTLVQQAQQAMADANDIVDTLSDIQDDTQAANEAANAAADKAEQAAADFDAMKADLEAAAQNLVGDTVDTKLEEVNSDIESLQQQVSTLETSTITAIGGLQQSVTTLNSTTIPALEQRITAAAQSGGDTVTIADENTSAAKIRTATVSGKGKYVVEKNYTAEGENEDGSMTQKAIKAYVESVKAIIDASVDEKISQIEVSGINFGVDNAGNIVIIGPDGNIVAGDTTETSIIEALIKSGTYHAKNAVGLTLDYENKEFSRSQESTNYTQGTEFDSYPMYGGRMRCNVADNGLIMAFYGDAGYKEDGTNGQVMVYQPKFYYQRIPIKLDNITSSTGRTIRKESIIISATQQSGFKLHPLFKGPDGEELDYVLLPAYEACTYDTSASTYNTEDAADIDFNSDMLSSIAGVKPISGYQNNLTPLNAEKLAQNRGSGWHITNMAAESANQMLEIIEFGTPNGQYALEDGISEITTLETLNYASQTGSTASLGNATGAAESTINISNGTTNTYEEAGKRAITYRGVENPWGNIWHMIGGINLVGDGSQRGGVAHICTNFNYSEQGGGNYESVGFTIPAVYDWVSGLGYGNAKYDWVFLPSECSSTANSALPLGDSLWSVSGLNATNMIAVGGKWAFKKANGPFYYACDKRINFHGAGFGVKIMFIPEKGSIYNANYNNWLRHMGG